MASVGAASCERCKQNGTAIIPGWDSSTMWYVLWVPQHSRREATSSENVPAITIKHSGPVFPPPPPTHHSFALFSPQAYFIRSNLLWSANLNIWSHRNDRLMAVGTGWWRTSHKCWRTPASNPSGLGTRMVMKNDSSVLISPISLCELGEFRL